MERFCMVERECISAIGSNQHDHCSTNIDACLPLIEIVFPLPNPMSVTGTLQRRTN